MRSEQGEDTLTHIESPGLFARGWLDEPAVFKNLLTVLVKEDTCKLDGGAKPWLGAKTQTATSAHKVPPIALAAARGVGPEECPVGGDLTKRSSVIRRIVLRVHLSRFYFCCAPGTEQSKLRKTMRRSGVHDATRERDRESGKD